MGEESVDNRPRYPDGELISEHPDSDEINRHWSFFIQFANAEQREVLQACKDIEVFKAFKQYAKPKSKEDAITKAIEWWMKWYPHEVKEFEFYIDMHKETLADVKGFTRGRDKMHMWQGSMPETIKRLLLVIDPNFFKVNSRGKNEGYSAFFKVYTKARIGGKH